MADHVTVDVGERQVRVSNPAKVYFPAIGLTKMDLVEYYLAVGEGALRGVRDRPTVLKRYPDGVDGEMFFQKRVPSSKPPWLATTTVTFPSGRSAEELCPADVAHVIWAVNLGCIDLNPWAVRSADLEHPDELRVDLDPMPEVTWDAVRLVALEIRTLLSELGMEGFPKTSGSRGIHINIPLAPAWGFTDVRRAALALAREIERRLPGVATSKWWREERGRTVFIDYNQNARDRTVASAYSVRATPNARVSAPLRWDEVPDATLDDFTVATMPERYAAMGDPAAGADGHAASLAGLLDLARRDEEEGLGDAPWPPNFPKAPGEDRRVRPSAAKSPPPPASAAGVS